MNLFAILARKDLVMSLFAYISQGMEAIGRAWE